MKSVEASDRKITIEGCPIKCATKTMELEGFEVDHQIIISELDARKARIEA